MKMFLESNLPGNPIFAEKKSQYVPPNGRYVTGNIGHQRIWAKTGSGIYPNFSTFVELVCLVGAHTGPRPGG